MYYKGIWEDENDHRGVWDMQVGISREGKMRLLMQSALTAELFPKASSSFFHWRYSKGQGSNCINQESVLILSFLMVSCFRRVWLCHQPSVKDKASKISESFSSTLFFPLSNLRCGHCITIPKGFLRNPAAGSATGAGIREMPCRESWVQLCPLDHTQHPGTLQRHCRELILLRVMFLFYIFLPRLRKPSCQDSVHCYLPWDTNVCLLCWSGKASVKV